MLDAILIVRYEMKRTLLIVGDVFTVYGSGFSNRNWEEVQS